MTSNGFLTGNFRPVQEEVTVTDLAVTGTIPAHLDGRYVRNGPNPIDADPTNYNWLTGHGMVHGVRLRDGRAEWYRNRWVRSEPVAAALGEAPPPGPTAFAASPSANIMVIGSMGKTVAISDHAVPFELNDELETQATCDFGGTLPAVWTGHPKRDPTTGEYHGVSYYVGWGTDVQYSVLGVDGRIRHAVDIPVGGMPMMHDFALSEDHVLLFDTPYVFDADKLLAGRALPVGWDADRPTRVGLLPRSGTADDVRWFEAEEPGYVMHSLNAWEDGDRTVVEVTRFGPRLCFDGIEPLAEQPRLERWTIDRSAGKVVQEVLDDRPQEFPRIDDRLLGRRHRYSYTVGFALREDLFPDPLGLIKYDEVGARSELRWFEGGGPNEFVFVPDGADAAEDAGTLMGYVYDPVTELSDLVLLDAASLETVATVHLPVRVPYGFHATWLPA